MKTLGLIGGTTWVSTSDYYKLINKEVNRMLGGHHSAKVILNSINFHEALHLQENADYQGLEDLLKSAAIALARAGVDGILICANTLHKYSARIQDATGLPLVHIVDETAMKIKEAGMARVGLLGTRPTMSEAFYRERMEELGVGILVPDERQQAYLHRAIIGELAKDIFLDRTRDDILKMMKDLHEHGAEAIILGCTEIPLIIRPEHTDLVFFDTLRIHAEAAARFIVND